jgi:hypothetical protein
LTLSDKLGLDERELLTGDAEQEEASCYGAEVNPTDARN